jgi:hypothetical protein
MMRIFKQLLFIAIITVCTSFAAYAQRQDDKRTPPKNERPPRVVVKEKDDKDKPKEDRPRDNDRRNDNRRGRPEE